MKTPYLVQRGKFKQPAKIEGIDSLIQFDYMGSSEFEFGALPKALKEICTVLPELECLWSNIRVGNKNLAFLCRPEDEMVLREFWQKAINDRYSVRTKELLWYGDKIGDGIDFWWDIGENQCWMTTIGIGDIKNVQEALFLVKKKKGW